MSVQQEHGIETVESLEETEKQSFTERLGLDPRYEAVVMDPVKGYGRIVDAWVRMKYPINVDTSGEHGVIEGMGSRHAKQYPDGSGVYESKAGTRLYAIRTAGGVVVWNERRSANAWPYGCEAEDDVDEEINVPFRFVGEVLTRQTDLNMHDEDSLVTIGAEDTATDTWVEGEMFMRGVVRADVLDDPDEAGILLEHKSGAQVYVGWDSTAHANRDMFGFCPFDGTDGVPAPSAGDALSLLTPTEAMSDQERQGEWFLVPTDGNPRGTIQKPGIGERPYGGSPLESHVPRDWKTGVPDLEFVWRVQEEIGEHSTSLSSPQDVFDSLHDGELDPETDLSYERARELAEGIYVRGTLRHRDSEHRMAKIDDWRQATTHDWDVVSQQGMNSYVPD